MYIKQLKVKSRLRLTQMSPCQFQRWKIFRETDQLTNFYVRPFNKNIRCLIIAIFTFKFDYVLVQPSNSNI